MNVFTESIRFWETLNHLIDQEGMRLVQLNEKEEVAWIEDDRLEPYQIIRLAHKNYDWSMQLKRDMDQTVVQAQQIRKKLGLRQANVINVILSAYLPVDDYERFTSQALSLTAGGKKQYRTILIPLNDLKNALFPLATKWELANMPSYIEQSYIGENEQEEAYLEKLKHTVKRSTKKREEKERSLFLFGKPYFTFVLLSLILSIFVFIEMAGSTTSTLTLIDYGAKFNPLIKEGEWWRFFSAMFLHIGFLHLFMNSLALFYLGGAVERIFGTRRFIIIYFMAGFIGSVSSFVFNDNVSAGASGAIFGCFGALLYFGLSHKRLFFRTMGMNVIVILIINLAFGFIVPMVDNGAHIGGLIGGFATSFIVGLPSQRGMIKKTVALVSTMILAAVLLTVGYQKELESEQIGVIYLQMARESIEADNVQEGQRYLLNVIENYDPISDDLAANVYFLLSYTQINEGEFAEAKENLSIVIDKNPSFHEAYYNLALVYYEEKQYEQALENVERALDIQAENKDYQTLYNELEQIID